MIVAIFAMESGAALSAFLILSSLLVGAADGFDGIVVVDDVVDDVVDAAVAVVSAPGVADLPQAVRHAIETTREKCSWMRINGSDYRPANIRARREFLLATHAGIADHAIDAGGREPILTPRSLAPRTSSRRR